MIDPSIILLIVLMILSIKIMKLIENISVEGWQDEEGFHFGIEGERDTSSSAGGASRDLRGIRTVE